LRELTLHRVGFWSAATLAVGTSVCAALGGLGGGIAEAEPPTTSVVFDQPGVYQWTVPAGVQSASTNRRNRMY